jgi:hypothetical protein
MRGQRNFSSGSAGDTVRYLVGGEATLETSVPEPATWAMLLVGIGGLGAMLRRARRRDGAALAA